MDFHNEQEGGNQSIEKSTIEFKFAPTYKATKFKHPLLLQHF